MQVKIFRVGIKYMQVGGGTNRSAWQLKEAVFESTSKQAVQGWASAVQARLGQLQGRPRRLLVIINPYGGAGAARDVWHTVRCVVVVRCVVLLLCGASCFGASTTSLRWCLLRATR